MSAGARTLMMKIDEALAAGEVRDADRMRYVLDRYHRISHVPATHPSRWKW